MNELIVKLDIDIDKIFDEEFQEKLNDMIKYTVIDKMKELVRETTVEIYKDSALDVSEAVLERYKQAHADFEASVKA